MTQQFPCTGHLLTAKLCFEHFTKSSLPPNYGADTATILILQMTHLRLKRSGPGSHTEPVSSRGGAKDLSDSKTQAHRSDSQTRCVPVLPGEQDVKAGVS